MKMRVLITRELPQVGINILHQYRELELDYRQGPPLGEEKLLQAIKGASAVITSVPDQINKKVITAAGKNLKIIAAYAVGYDHIDVTTATQKGIYVANTPGSVSEAVGEHTFTLMLSLARRITEADRFVRAKNFKYWDPMSFIGPKMVGKTLGIIGFGNTGQQLGRMAKYGLGMKILYTDPVAHSEAENLIDAQKVSLDYLLENSDVVSINCNLNPQTKHLIGEPQLKKMKPLAYLINTSRGAVIHEEALAAALKEGVIAGAALDVFENEPKIHPDLLKLDNVILTPHIGSATWEARILMARMSAENVVDVLINNKPPRYLVNKDLTKEKIQSLI